MAEHAIEETPYDGPTAEELAVLREQGEDFVKAAARSARAWRTWTTAFDALIEKLPFMPPVRAVPEDLNAAEPDHIDLGIDHINREVMRLSLVKIRAQADAVTMGYLRGRDKSRAVTATSLAEYESTTDAEAGEPGGE